MYKVIKGILLQLIPKKLLFKFESPIRFIYALFYKGNKYQCNICNTNLSHFLPYHDDQICPRCGSLKRTRRLWDLLEKNFLKEHTAILDFSPSRSIYRKLKPSKYKYLGSDLSGDFLSDVSYDITKIDAENERFDLIICYHILEHIYDDRKAMNELFRVLKNGGNCLIQTPFKEGNIYEDDTIQTPEEREQHFGQADHVRIYSVNALAERLCETGFQVEVKIFTNDADNRNGFSQNETILICSKPL